MGFFDLFSVKSEKKRLDVPMAPGSFQDRMPKLPEFPTFKKDVELFENSSVRKQDKQLRERNDLDLKSPIFVEMASYKAMVDEIMQVNVILKENEAISLRFHDFTNDCDKEYGIFRKELEDIQRKLIFCDKKLFG